MSYFKKSFFNIGLLICFIFTGTIVVAQDVENTDSEVSEEEFSNLAFVEFSLDRIYPISTYKENLDRNLWGFSFSNLYQYNKKKLDMVGFQINYAHIGRVSQTYADYEVSTGSNVIGIQGLYRHFLDFYFWKIEPFIEVEFGPQFYYTQTTTSFFDDSSSDDIDFEEFDTGIMYGLGAGFTLHVVGDVFLMSKLSFIGGTSVTYLVDRDGQSGLPIDDFRPETTQTNYLKWRMGITISL